MTTVRYFYCPTCRRPLDYGLADLKDGNLVADCGRCRKPVVLERGLRCGTCGRPATATERRLGSELAGAGVTATYYCDEHFAAARDTRIRRRRTFWVYALPVIGAVFLGLGLFAKGGNGKPSPVFFLVSALSFVQAVVLWRRLKEPHPPESEK